MAVNDDGEQGKEADRARPQRPRPGGWRTVDYEAKKTGQSALAVMKAVKRRLGQ